MKSSINVRYNVYVPKAERGTHLNRATRTVYLLGSKFEVLRGAARARISRVYSVTRAVRSSVKRLNSAKNTNDSVI